MGDGHWGDESAGALLAEREVITIAPITYRQLWMPPAVKIL